MIDFICLFWVGINSWFSAKKVEKMLHHLRHLLGSKWHVLRKKIDFRAWPYVEPFGNKMRLDYRPKKIEKILDFIIVFEVEKTWVKSIKFSRGKGGVSILAPLGIKVTLDYRPQKIKKFRYYKRVLCRKNYFERGGGGGLELKNVAPFRFKITLHYRPKKLKSWGICGNFWDQITLRPKKSKILKIL